MQFYKTIDTLPALNFFSVIKKNDYRYLLKTDFDNVEDIEISEKLKIELSETWFKLKYQFAKVDMKNEQLTANLLSMKLRMFYETDAKKIELKNKINVLEKQIRNKEHIEFETDNETDIYVESTILSKLYGFLIDLRKVSIKQYLSFRENADKLITDKNGQSK
jgi:hypothetical protein